MAKQRKSRDKIDKSNYDLLKPIDILTMGSEDDPCFGKFHDLLAKECRLCGDSEFCAIVKAQNLRIGNLEVKDNKRFKDVEEGKEIDEKKKLKAIKLIDEYRSNGLKSTKILLKVWAETHLPKDEIKQLLKS